MGWRGTTASALQHMNVRELIKGAGTFILARLRQPSAWTGTEGGEGKSGTGSAA